MKNIYNALSTPRIINRVLSQKFKMAQKGSDGYKFINAIYGIEVDEIKSFIDQGKHYSNFELMDYGIDYRFSEIKIPEVIRSGYITGTIGAEQYPIKITKDVEFYTGVPTRFVTMSGIDITDYVQSSGILGMEYMRTTQEGSGILYINSELEAVEAVLSNKPQSYKLPMDDLTNPIYSDISGYNPSIAIQSYETTGKYEYFDTVLEESMKKQYPLSKKFYLPKNGMINGPKVPFELDYYLPERYVWDSVKQTYIVAGFESDTYYEGTVEKYHRVALNNPNGSGVYNVNVFDLKHLPISGTLTMYDVDNLDDFDNPIEIPQSGIWSYIYETDIIPSGENLNETKSLVYIGYSEDVPGEYGLPSGTKAVPYKYTTWEYVNVGDGVEEFNWVKHPETPIDNRIRIINPISRYFVEYTHTSDVLQKAITTASSTKYIKEDINEHIYATTDINHNATNVKHKFVKDSNNRLALSFNSIDVRPGATIDNIAITGEIKRNFTVNKTNTTYFGIPTIPGCNKNVYPNTNNIDEYKLNHSVDNIELSGVYGSTLPSITTGLLGQYIPDNIGGIGNDKHYRLWDDNVTDNVLRIKYKSLRRNNYTIFKTNNNDTGEGWSLYIGTDNFIYLSDETSTFKSVSSMIWDNKEVDIIVAYDSSYTNTINSDRYNLYVSTDDQFFTRFNMIELPLSKPFIPSSGTYTSVFPEGLVDLAYVKVYNERNI